MALAGFGMPEADIATVLGIDPKTLRKHYRLELDTGHLNANAKVAQSLYAKALGDGKGSVTAAIFWLKTRAGWKETPQAVEVTGADGGPVLTGEVSDRDRARALHAFLARAKAATAAQG